MAHCPECGTLIDIDADELEEGETISCPECAVDLEVVNTHPLELDVIGDEEDEEADEEEGSLDEEEDEGDEVEDEEGNGFH